MKIEVLKDSALTLWQKFAAKRFFLQKFLCLVVSRQCGKTYLGHFIVVDFIFKYCKRKNPVAIIAANTHEQAFDLYFAKIDAQLKDLPEWLYLKKGSAKNGYTITIKRPWLKDYVTIYLIGTENPKAVRGKTVDLLVLDEMAFFNPDIWLSIFEPMLITTKGYVYATSTPNGFNHFYKLFKHHQTKNQSMIFDCYQTYTQTDKYWDDKRATFKALGEEHTFDR